MRYVVERACGLDVHEAQITACILSGREAEPKPVLREFGTVRQDLIKLHDWLAEQGVTHVAMEATGVYWMPVYAMLEAQFDVTVANAKRIKNVPGRKTDVCDAVWIATLMRYGLLQKSFIPSAPIRELRDLVRYRQVLIDQRTAERNRLLKVLEQAGIKISTFVSDPFGVSGMKMIRALAEGTLMPEEMANMARGRLRSKVPQLCLALEGSLAPHQRLMLEIQIGRLDEADKCLKKVQVAIDERVKPYARQIEMMCAIPGVEQTAAIRILAEIGDDLSSFPTDANLASWAGVCPGNNRSAGKNRGGRRRSGNPHLQSILVESAWAACRKKGSYLKSKYYRLKARRGGKRAAMAIGRKILCAIYRVVTTGEPYQDLGENYIDPKAKDNAISRHLGALRALGVDVVIKQPNSERSAP